MNEIYILKLIRLINRGIITINNIVDIEYKTEIQMRLG